MRRSGILMLLFTLLVISLVIAGYLGGLGSFLSPQSSQQTGTKVNVGLLPLSTTGQPPSIAFEDAIGQLSSVLLEKGGVSSNFTIHYIRGKDLNHTGYASTWMFGVRYENRSTLAYYDQAGWTLVPWQGGLPEPEIVEGTFITPKEIIERNSALIFGDNSAKDERIQTLELGSGIYTLKIHRSGITRVFLFEAFSGGLIPSYA
jgi:hypothetical protein